MFLKLYKAYLRRYRPLKYWTDLGVKFGSDCRLVGNVDFGSEPYLVSIGDHVSITNSQLITHDGGVWVFRLRNPRIDVFGPINIGNNVFIGANCIIMPGTLIGDNVVVGAGSLVRGRLENNTVYAGVPIRKIKTIEEYYNGIKNKSLNTKGLDYEGKKNFIRSRFKL